MIWNNLYFSMLIVYPVMLPLCKFLKPINDFFQEKLTYPDSPLFRDPKSIV